MFLICYFAHFTNYSILLCGKMYIRFRGVVCDATDFNAKMIAAWRKKLREDCWEEEGNHKVLKLNLENRSPSAFKTTIKAKHRISRRQPPTEKHAKI